MGHRADGGGTAGVDFLAHGGQAHASTLVTILTIRISPAGGLTATWWQWLYTVPLPENPGFDTTGEYAFENQPFDDLIFLAGTFSQQTVENDVYGEATRSITVERGTAFFFPLINTEWDNVMFNTPTPGTASVVNNPEDGGLTIKELYANAASSVDGALSFIAR